MLRRNFLRNASLFVIGTPVFANAISPTSLFSTDIDLFQKLKPTKVAVENLSTALQVQFDKCTKLLIEKGFQFNVENLMYLNTDCIALAIEKPTLFLGKEAGLLMVTKKDYAILNSNQISEYANFIDNYTIAANEHHADGIVEHLVLPTKIKTSNTHTDFVFKNELGNTIKIHASSKRNYTHIS